MKAINKLKKKLLLIIMLFVTCIIVFFIITINVIPFRQLVSSADAYLHELADDASAKSPTPPAPKRRALPDSKKRNSSSTHNQYSIFSSSNVVYIELDSDKNIESWRSDNTTLYDDTYISNTTNKIIHLDKDFDIIDGHFYLQVKKHNGYLIILLDSYALLMNFNQTIICSIIVGLLIWFFSAMLATYMINLLTKPLVLSLENQQQFISDAEHEFKTPISVIASNADVLRAEIGENVWLSHIISETKRMSVLVHELLSLSMIDDTNYTSANTYFDMGETLTEVILPFESVAYEKGITIELNISPHITCHGNEEQIKQLMAILLHNAIKFGNENGVIKITLLQSKKKAVLKVYNTGEGITSEDIDKIFDRFYRVSKSRNSASGGHGLGLSIAKSIVEKHNGSISATSAYKEWAQFEIQLPCINR